MTLILGLAGCKSAEERAAEYFETAQTLAAENDFDRAVVALRNVFDLDGSHREARRMMADIMLTERGDRQQAYGQYLRLAEQYPDDLEARIALAQIAFAATNWDELERHGAQAAALAPDDPRVIPLTTARTYRTAVLANDAAARRTAADTARALVDSQPDNMILRSIIIDDLLRGGDLRGAMTEIDLMLVSDPANILYHQQRLNILAELGDMEGLENQLRTMIAQFPDDDVHKATLLRFFLSRDDLDAGETFLRDLVAKAPADDPTAKGDLIRFLAEYRTIAAAKAEIAATTSTVADPLPFLVIDAGLDFATGARSDAIATLETALQDHGTSPQAQTARVTLARMLSAMGNPVGARARVEEVLAADAGNPDALKLRAGWLIADDKTEDAITALRTALDRSPDDAAAMTLMADAYIRSGRPQLARDFLALAVDASGNAPAETIRYARQLIGEGSYLAAEDILIASLRLNADNPDLLQTLGQAYLQMEDFARTQQVVATLRRSATPAAEAAANRIEAERIARQSGRDDALAYLEGLANRADAGLTDRITLMRARINSGDIDGALALATDLAATDPGNDDLRFMLATTQVLAGDLDAARAGLRALLATEPRRPAVWLELSKLAQRQGDRDAAKAVVAEALGHMPDDVTLLWAQASFLEQDGDIDGAIAIYENLYAQNSGALVIANNLASLLSTYRDDAESLERAWTVARRFSDTGFAPVQDTYGWILHRRGESEQALPYLESAAAALPDDPLAQYHLGQTYAALGRPDDALAQFQRVVALAGPGDTRPQIATARREIQTLLDGTTTTAE
ncbi:MAG: tetratricopeptide repeat protein [Yoonia sp.]|nr:tetratricopeptide repeat protein [Yoonia sp.]